MSKGLPGRRFTSGKLKPKWYDAKPEGLLNIICTPNPTYDETAEKALAKRMLEYLENELQKLPVIPGFDSNPLAVERFDFRKRLINFALKRHISFLESDWQDLAIFRAAMEHPELNPDKKGKGRPRNFKLHDLPCLWPDTPTLDDLEPIMKKRGANTSRAIDELKAHKKLPSKKTLQNKASAEKRRLREKGG